MSYSQILLSCATPLFVLAAAGCGAPVQPHFQDLQDEVFTPRCTFDSCHSSDRHAGELVLVEGESYGQLVGVMPDLPTAASAGLLRVDPGNVENSLLVLKVRRPVAAEHGDAMPFGDDVGMDEDIVAAIETWVADGALDD